ncbi:MAG: hypothetical protein RL432_1889 [Bacteroidota bacterium]|jgi:uncharacterized protein (TIGR02145 family)
MKNLGFFAVGIMIALTIESCSFSYSGNYIKNQDQDGNEFQSVIIQNQEWMSENLQTSTFCNGDKIQEAKNSKAWQEATRKKKPAWCWKFYNIKNRRFGKYYNHYALTDKRGLAPKGWKIPSVQDYQKNIAPIYWLGSKGSISDCKSDNGWIWSCNGSNSTGFSALPSGYYSKKGKHTIENCAYFWTKNNVINKTYPKAINSPSAYFITFHTCDCYDYDSAPKSEGMPVRCIKISNL